MASRQGARGRGYLADRGITSATQLKFRLGYGSAEQYVLKEHLGAAKVSVEDMVEAGLLVAGDDIPVPYDRFRDRVMFPISDWRGRVIAFGGRALEKEVAAKYLNSPETPLFHKGATLYNIAAARKAAHEGGRVIAVEGYIDVIAMVTAGFEATVAPLGTALTADQLGLLWRMADEPTLCFDGDDAGRRAAYRALDVALPLIKPGKSLKLAALPDGQDPDDLARSGGREAIEDVLSAARPLADMLWARETEAGPFTTPERRAAFEARLSEVTNTVADETVRRYYRADFAARLRALFASAEVTSRRRDWDERGRRGAPGPRPISHRGGFRPRRGLRGDKSSSCGRAAPSRPSDRRTAPGGADPASRAQPSLAHARPPGGVRRDRISPRRRKEAQGRVDRCAGPSIRSRCRPGIGTREPGIGQEHDQQAGEANLYVEIDRVELVAELSRRGFADLMGRIERTITTPSVWGAREDAAADDVLLTWKQLLALHRQWHSLTRELKDAELALGQDNSEANYARLRDVKSRISTLDGTEALIEGFGDQSGRPTRSF